MTRLPTVFFVDPDNTKRDLNSPEMKGLVEQGYTIGPAMLWQEGKGSAPKLALIMVPSGGATALQRAQRHASDRRSAKLAAASLVALLAAQTTCLVIIAVIASGV